MDIGLQLKNLTNLIFAFLTFLLLLFSYGMIQINSVEEEQLICGTKNIELKFPQESENEIRLGMQLFKNNCGSCHAKNMKAKMTGPALFEVEKRWNGNRENLYAWIRNSQAYLLTDDPYAKKLYAEYGESVMTAFPSLKDEEIDAILDYIKYVAN
ncbi:MAG: c-type cytochrome [Saprospiraceae bacterium]